jgi:ribosome biogenesis GTPase A
MIELMTSEKQEVALNAAKYVLDSTGYKPTDNINLDTTGSIKINIVED